MGISETDKGIWNKRKRPHKENEEPETYLISIVTYKALC
jgi:hypothetical protein